MKLCKDCKFHRRNYIFYLFRCEELDKCAHPRLIDLVNGIAVEICATQRNHHPCGPEGKLWEAKE